VFVLDLSKEQYYGQLLPKSLGTIAFYCCVPRSAEYGRKSQASERDIPQVVERKAVFHLSVGIRSLRAPLLGAAEAVPHCRTRNMRGSNCSGRSFHDSAYLAGVGTAGP